MQRGYIILLSLLILEAQCTSKISKDNDVHRYRCDDIPTAIGRGGSNLGTIPSIASDRRACQFYVWNGISALLFRWCNHLQRDSIYEGRGGKKVCSYALLSPT
jgi:hypothetical protein